MDTGSRTALVGQTLYNGYKFPEYLSAHLKALNIDPDKQYSGGLLLRSRDPIKTLKLIEYVFNKQINENLVLIEMIDEAYLKINTQTIREWETVIPELNSLFSLLFIYQLGYEVYRTEFLPSLRISEKELKTTSLGLPAFGISIYKINKEK